MVACPTVSVGNYEAGMPYQTLHSEAESLNLLSEGHRSSEAIDLEQEAPLGQSNFYRNWQLWGQLLEMDILVPKEQSAHQVYPLDVYLSP